MQAASFTAKTLTSMHEIEPVVWNSLTDSTPFLKHAFLLALEESKSIGEGTGWHTSAIVLHDQASQVIGAMPAYLKTHSYGEYVFDWAWADAYAKHDMAYYPKLVSAIPFTPVTCNKLLCHDEATSHTLVAAMSSVLAHHQLSSAHVLFPSDLNHGFFEQADWLRRDGVQFRWQNKDYADWDDFLMTLSHDKRKKIRQERKKIQLMGVQCRWLTGRDITESDWDFFYACYCNTYRAHYSTPYLTRAFFSLIGQTMSANLLLILAEVDGKPVAATLNIYDDNTLYGRYWGAIAHIPNLHFELCYYQAQAFCIAKGLRYFEGGAQGEHKLARGFEPRPTCSYHHIAHPDFRHAIARFIQQEAGHIQAYTNELEERAPFKKSSG